MNDIVRKLKINNADKVLEKRAKVKYFHVFIEDYGAYLFKGTIAELEESMRANGSRTGLRSEKHEIPWRLYEDHEKMQEDLVSWKVAIIKFLGEEKLDEFIKFKEERDRNKKPLEVAISIALESSHASK